MLEVCTYTYILCVPMQALSHDVDSFCEQVEECIGRQHYESTHLALLARSLQEKKGRVSRAMADRVRVAKGGVGFYKGVHKVRNKQPTVIYIIIHIYMYMYTV